MEIRIGNKILSKGSAVFVIAEAGVNHNGVFDRALAMVDVAKNAGADAIKFQTFTAQDMATSDTYLAGYAEKNLGRKERMVDMLATLELTQDNFRKIKEYCDAQGIIFLSTPHTVDAVDFLDELMPAFKVASGDITNIPFLGQIAEKNKPVLLATGMATLDEVAEAVKIIRTAGNESIILLHCTSLYPCEPKDVNLRAMQTLRQTFQLPIGYSDHTLGMDAAKLAIELGAVVIEKHFTLDQNLPGPDHKASFEPKQLAEMISQIRNKDTSFSVEKEVLLGSAEKRPTAKECEVAAIARKSIVAARNIAQGDIITHDMLSIKRPGTGLSPARLNTIIGKRARRDIASNSLFLEEDI